MTQSRARRKFPQLAHDKLKYCAVFYEGTHDDSRTNIAVAQTAARDGAVILNYFEVIGFLKDDDSVDSAEVRDPINAKVKGVLVKDSLTDQVYSVHASNVLVCGGPFTDSVRKMQNPKAAEAVTGAAGIHIVLPSYFAPATFGLVDMQTSDGRFLFFLPWNGHVLVGTTDHKTIPSMRPEPDESVSSAALVESICV